MKNMQYGKTTGLRVQVRIVTYTDLTVTSKNFLA